MLTHKEFYIWLEGYLYGKLENKHIEILPIIEKMGQVKDNEFKSNMLPFQNIPIPINLFKSEDDLGYPPKIVM